MVVWVGCPLPALSLDQGDRVSKAQGDNKFLKDVSLIREEYLDCRDLGHYWQHMNTEQVYNKTLQQFVRTMLCARCGTERNQTTDNRGYLIRSSYRYVKDYLLEGNGYLTIDDRAKMRLRNIKRGLQ